ncbi:lanthionine synthetase LanC family protein [Nonomuraea wenchangensis]
MTMTSAQAKLVLPADVVITPVDQVPRETRARFEHADGDYCVTRPHSRTTTCVVSGPTAELLERFRTPTSIVDAVVEFATASQRDAHEVLQESFPVLSALAADGLLTLEGDVAAEAVRPLWAPGDRVADITIVRCVRVLDDTEVYLGRTERGEFVAVKRPGRSPGPSALTALRHEARVLSRLAGRAGPALRQVEDDGEGEPVLVLGWVSGVDLETAGADLRGPERRAELLNLAAEVLDCYAGLHACGVLHGDVHPRNVLVGPDNEVTVLDFGAACLPDAGGAPVRGGIDTYQAPEIARARRQTGFLPEPSAASEQYSVGALVYLLITGGATHLFSLQPGEMLRQVMADAPLPFEHYGLSSPAVERCLLRALAKEPHERHPSVHEFADSFRHAAAADLRAAPRALRLGLDQAAEGLDQALTDLSPTGNRQRNGLPAPTASIGHGAAGLAYALLHVAHALDRPDVLAAADMWSTRAVLSETDANAFRDDSRGIGPSLFGNGSLFHHAGGVHLVHALVAHARGDSRTCRTAVDSFLRCAQPDDALDVAFGRAGLLLGCTTLVALLGPEEELIARGTAIGDGLWAALADHPTLKTGEGITLLGASHGWAGMLTALLRWSMATSTPPPEGLAGRLQELAEFARPLGRGLVWPRKSDGSGDDATLSASWCNGSAGYVALWTAAEQVFAGDQAQADTLSYGDLARAAAWHAYEAPGSAPAGVCCGLAGRGLALMALHQHTGEPAWLARARLLSARAAAESALGRGPAPSAERRVDVVESSDNPGLLHGPIGPALLTAQLIAPDNAVLSIAGAW